jgi:LacI family transcriptional regulator
LNYVANAAVHNLASGESKIIGILVSNILNPFQAALTKAIDTAGRAAGFDLLLSINGGYDAEAENSIASLVAQHVAGLVLIEAPQSPPRSNASVGRFRQSMSAGTFSPTRSIASPMMTSWARRCWPVT